MTQHTDLVLIEKTLNGDRIAFGELIEKYQKQIYSLAYRLTNNADDAQDLAQEIFIKVYQVLSKYDQERPFFPWLYRVATNVCYTELRRKPNGEVSLEKVIEVGSLIPISPEQPEEEYVQKETQMLVQQALAELPENYRVPMVLRYLEELSYQEIADAMELPLTTIETRLYRGRILLQKRLNLVFERGLTNEMSGS
ncbi:MAG: sigma-70 family RNA polymerase sigma factor [Bacillota bacterium]